MDLRWRSWMQLKGPNGLSKHNFQHDLSTMDIFGKAVNDVMDVPDHVHWDLIAAHELGHALGAMVGGMPCRDITINLDGRLGMKGASATTVTIIPLGATAVMERADMVSAAAGERAQDRRLRELGIWSPHRALATEIQASHDRERIMEQYKVGYADAEILYGDLMDEADRLLDRIWTKLTKCITFLAESGYMTGDRIAILTGIPNPALR